MAADKDKTQKNQKKKTTNQQKQVESPARRSKALKGADISAQQAEAWSVAARTSADMAQSR